MKKFNVTGVCVPSQDYIADINDKLDKITDLVDRGYYFTINRARQYGKTTTLSLLQKKISGKYICARISFEGVGDDAFGSQAAFCGMFVRSVSQAMEYSSAPAGYAKKWLNDDVVNIETLSGHITEMCKDNKIVLIIDEIDKPLDNRILIQFLGMLRSKYLFTKENMDYTFYSVILAGVTDIKNMKLKITYDYNSDVNDKSDIIRNKSRIYNSPWNIAADFNVDMSFKPNEIEPMLIEYEKDHLTGMDIPLISSVIFEYTSSYPFLVTLICKTIDERLNRKWDSGTVIDAIKIILDNNNTLFEDIFIIL